mgnify:CR=1 FL=1
MTLDHCSEGHLIAEELAAEGYPAIVGPDLASRSKIEVQNMAFKTAGILNRAGGMTALTGISRKARRRQSPEHPCCSLYRSRSKQ